MCKTICFDHTAELYGVFVKRGTDSIGVRRGARSMNRLTCRLQDRHKNMFGRLLVILVAFWSLLSGCAETKQDLQTDSNSVLQKPENDNEVHGEVGVMYGHSAR